MQTAVASSRECVIERSIFPAPTRSAQAFVRPERFTPGLRATRDLDLAPRKVDARAERLPDRLLGREARRVVLGRVRLAVAVGALSVGKAALAEARIALERPRDPRDLDQVDANAHRKRF